MRPTRPPPRRTTRRVQSRSSPGLMGLYNQLSDKQKEASALIQLYNALRGRSTQQSVINQLHPTRGQNITIIVEGGDRGSGAGLLAKLFVAALMIALVLTGWFSGKQIWQYVFSKLPGQTTALTTGTPAPPPPGGWRAFIAVHVDPTLTPTEAIPEWEEEVSEIASYVVGNFGTYPKSKFKVSFVPPEGNNGCSTGLAKTEPEERHLTIWTCDRKAAMHIAAHEIVHQLEEDRYGPVHRTSFDLILAEGAATWAAGKHWLNDESDWRTYVQNQKRAGTFLPLAMDHKGVIATMNAIYPEWASLVEYLIGKYGREKFDQVYVRGNSGIGSADYKSVYGKDFATLEAEWISWIGN
jgi:hypothetical protein